MDVQGRRWDEVVSDDGKRKIEIDMSMTAPGCGMGDVLRDNEKEGIEPVNHSSG